MIGLKALLRNCAGRFPPFCTGPDGAPRRSLSPMTDRYVHGYDARETQRLTDQAETLVDLLHHDTRYPPEETVLEVGCGVGAQTLTLARRSPGTAFTSVDVSPESVAEAQRRVQAAGLDNVTVEQADLFELPLRPAAFDHVFVCFVLEHLPAPEAALTALSRVVRPGGSITVIEGDHGSTTFHPDSQAAQAAVACQVELQRRAGGDATIGRRLYPLLTQAGVDDVRVSPRLVYVDASRPQLVDGFTRRTFTAMVAGVREPAITHGLTTADAFDQGIADLLRTTESDGTFAYTFYKAFGTFPAPATS